MTSDSGLLFLATLYIYKVAKKVSHLQIYHYILLKTVNKAKFFIKFEC